MITTITDAWKNRENRVKTLDCEWVAESMCGAKTWVYRDEQGKQFAIPPNDLTTHAEYRFRLQDRHKMRFEYTGPQPIQDTRSFEERKYVSVTDSKEQKCFYGKDQTSEDLRFPPRGFINKEETLPETGTIHLWPLLMLYRPSTREIAAEFDLTKFSPKGRITIAGRECLLLERTGRGVDKQELAIDLNRDFVPVRVRDLARDVSKGHDTWLATSLIDIDYTDQADGKWRPAGWKTAILRADGKVREQMKAVVKRFNINADIPDSVFQFDFPMGTIVRNWKTDERYLLREGGEKRRITQGEMDAHVPYKQLLTTEPGMSLRSRGGVWRVVVLVVCSVLLLLLLIIRLIYARLKRT